MPLYYLLALAVGGEIIDLVGETGPVAKIVLLILLIFSLISWAIILSKWSVLRRARVQSGRFLRAFRKAERLQDVAAVAEQFRPSPLVGVFEGAFQEYRRQGGLSNGLIRSPLAIQRRCRSRRQRNSRASSAICPGWRSPAPLLHLWVCSERFGESLMPFTD